MSRIDEPYGQHPLNEKPSHAERLDQALDDNNASGEFRELVKYHFSQPPYVDRDHIDQVLQEARLYESPEEQCLAFIAELINLKLNGLNDVPFVLSFADRPEIIFARAVAEKYFPGRPLSFFKKPTQFLGEEHKISGGQFSRFAMNLYSNEILLAPDFFDDPVHSSHIDNPRQRAADLAGLYLSLVDHTNFTNGYDPEPEIKTHNDSRPERYLRALVKQETKSGRLKDQSYYESTFNEISEIIIYLKDSPKYKELDLDKVLAELKEIADGTC